MTKTTAQKIIDEMKAKYIGFAAEMFKYSSQKSENVGGLDYEYYENESEKAASGACAVWECIEIVNSQADIYNRDEMDELHGQLEYEARKGANQL